MEPFGFYVLCDEDGEKIDLTYISELAFWETPLTDEQVYAMGNLFPTTEIGSLSDLNDFTQAVNSGQDVNGKLTADINIGTSTTSIGTSENTFAGIFDGQGHSITGFSATSEIDGGGLFGQTNGALIKDFSIYGTLTSTEVKVPNCGQLLESFSIFIISSIKRRGEAQYNGLSSLNTSSSFFLNIPESLS